MSASAGAYLESRTGDDLTFALTDAARWLIQRFLTRVILGDLSVEDAYVAVVVEFIEDDNLTEVSSEILKEFIDLCPDLTPLRPRFQAVAQTAALVGCPYNMSFWLVDPTTLFVCIECETCATTLKTL